MVHQELNPEPYLTVAENLFLHRESMVGKTIFLDKKAQNAKAQAILDQFDVKFSAKTMMQDMTLAQVQMAEIIKAVSCDARLIIMDEPTSSLDSNETEHLFSTIRDLKSKGVSIIYISHRMEEIFEICDQVSVFRDGTYIDSRPVSGVSHDELIRLMVVRTVESVFPKVDCPIGGEVFRVEHLCGDGFEDINFTVHAGEILGLSGLVGSGRSEGLRSLSVPLPQGKHLPAEPAFAPAQAAAQPEARKAGGCRRIAEADGQGRQYGTQRLFPFRRQPAKGRPFKMDHGFPEVPDPRRTDTRR